jgi:undecaprenyl-diphosphatase
LLQQIFAHDQRLSARLALPGGARLLRLLALTVAHTGDSPLWLLGAAAALLWGAGHWRDFGWRVLLGTLVAGGVVAALKWLFRRERPPGESRGFYGQFDRHSFPSGHAGRSACLVVLLFPLVPFWAGMLLVFWAGLVGLARVALRVHFVSDIVGGWVVGLVLGLGLVWFF